MPQLKTNEATPAATFGASKTSQTFYVNGGIVDIYLSGTASTSTLTLKACRTQGGTFDTYYADDPTGTPAALTFTVTEVPASSMYHLCLKEHGMFFQFTTDGTGTPAWEIDVNGPYVRIFE
jgi:hypothetical protein